jgi:surfactin synthase thioesterase subunit
MEILKGFFKGEYATDAELTSETNLREDLWLDYLGLEELNSYLHEKVPSLKPINMDHISTLGDLLKLLPAVAVAAEAKLALPVRSTEALKLWFPVVIDRFKEKRQTEGGKAVPMISFYHAGGMVANMRMFSKELDAVTGPVAVDPMWVELPGRGVRGKDTLCTSCKDTSAEIAAVVASQVLQGDTKKSFLVFGHSVGTLHAFEVTRELQKLGFVPKALIVLNRQAPQIPMDRPEDNFTEGLTDDQFISKMSAEYGQKTLLDMWKSNPEIVRAGIPATRADMKTLTSYRLEAGAEKLRCPVLAVASSKDRPSNSVDNVSAWKSVTEGSFVLHTANGGHFAYTDDPKSVMSWLGKEIQKLIA